MFNFIKELPFMRTHHQEPFLMHIMYDKDNNYNNYKYYSIDQFLTEANYQINQLSTNKDI